MNATRWIGFSVGVLGLLATGCGGGGAMSEAKAPAPVGRSSGANDVSASATQPSAPADAPAPGVMSGDFDGKAAEESRGGRAEPSARPGLGTEWGETRQSHISQVSFSRADSDTPFSTASLFYNDTAGARAMANQSGFKRNTGGSFTIANGLLSIGLKSEGGGFFNGFTAGDRNYSVGENGQRYTIVVHNNSNLRLEIVMSVDGLDVLDGKDASFTKRGYLVDPHGDVEVDGFRQSLETVAAFRFGSVKDSYASKKTGETRNVGVIGFAIFNERGTNPLTALANEATVRHDANPFPGQFATPPGR